MAKEISKTEIPRFEPDLSAGLTEENVNYRLYHKQINEVKNPTNKSYLGIIIGNIFTFFNLLMFAVAALLVVVVGPKVITNLMFLIIIICNILIGTIQECKSKHTIEKLKLLSINKIRVKRGGKEVLVMPNEIVLDELILLSAGDQIPVDCIILDDEIVEVNESLLTGESVPVKKSKGDVLYAGSFIVSGACSVKADKIANDTYIHSIESKARLSKQPKSRLMMSINHIIKSMACIAIPLAIIVFINEFIHSVNSNANIPIFPTFWGQDSMLTEAVFYGGTTISYMIPAGMALLASVAMATGVVKLAQSKTLAQDLYSVESLSRVNTLCLDKTGTLTDGTMVLEEVKMLSKEFNEHDVDLFMSSYLSAFKSENQTSTALIAKFGKTPYLGISDTIQFSSARKYSAVKFNEYGWFALGAPEYLTSNKSILSEVNEYARNGLRVVILVKINEDFTEDGGIPESRKNIAMFTIRDHIRPEVKPTMEWFRENDVDIKVISGDNIGTVSYIAKQSGIANWDKVVDMSKLPEDANLNEIVMNNSIFGRVTPDQKAEIIKILKEHDRVVGVTGDGLNDLLAFKQADCSIALANGAAATKNVANLILLDSNFANMKEAVFQGRRVVNNIQRSATLFVMKDYLWMFITVLPLLFGLAHVVQPTVMTIVNIFITGIASLCISLEPDKTRVTGNFYKNVTRRGIISGFYLFIPVLLIFIYFLISQLARDGALNPELMETVLENGEVVHVGWLTIMSLCITIAGFVIFFSNCIPFTRFRRILFFIILGVVLVALYLLPEFFIVSGTKMLDKTQGGIDDIREMFPYIFSHLRINVTGGIYRLFALEQVLFIGIFAVLAYPLYKLNNIVVGKLLDKFLFSTREFKDE